MILVLMSNHLLQFLISKSIFQPFLTFSYYKNKITERKILNTHCQWKTGAGNKSAGHTLDTTREVQWTFSQPSDSSGYDNHLLDPATVSVTKLVNALCFPRPCTRKDHPSNAELQSLFPLESAEYQIEEGV